MCKQQCHVTLTGLLFVQHNGRLSCTFLERVADAELIMRRPWFVGTSDLDILGKIFQALGTPTPAQWPGMRDLPNFVEFQQTVAPPLGSVVKGVSICSHQP